MTPPSYFPRRYTQGNGKSFYEFLIEFLLAGLLETVCLFCPLSGGIAGKNNWALGLGVSSADRIKHWAPHLV
ncbi:MAG: hypothetical protein ICV62_08475 [Cyanobacteria bacterium Co-bin13]|nr:hypothetical protein [Cyanobacteria bacterium Co-bin13]